MQKADNFRIESFRGVPSPGDVIKKTPISERAEETVIKGRKNIENILAGKDNRIVLVVGPCSIHDLDSALEYAKKLNEIRKKVEDRMVVVMRTYFEKPRTTVGWKGYVYDPFLNGSYEFEEGVFRARKSLLEINEMGLPTGTEVLVPFVIEYYSDLISWSSIGARTAQSQTHRELASGLPMPVGFKNATDGNVEVALDGISFAKTEQSFLKVNKDGKVGVARTKGNPYCHIILRGGTNGPNYSKSVASEVKKLAEEADIDTGIFVDCSHANSGKDFRKQGEVWESVWEQISGGEISIKGVMLESHLFEGKQSIKNDPKKLKYGISITDGCIGFAETEKLIMEVFERLQ